VVSSPLDDALKLLAEAQAAEQDEDARALLEQALVPLDLARRAGDGPLAVQLALGVAESGLRRWDQARFSFRRALNSDDSAPGVADGLEETLERLAIDQDWKTWAADRMEEVLTGLGRSEEWRNWADDLRRRDDDEGALRAYLHAGDANALASGGDLLLDMHRPYHALDWYEDATAAAERDAVGGTLAASVRIRAGSVFLELRQHRRALEEADRAVKSLDELVESAEVAFFRAWAAYVSGWARFGIRRYEQAADDFERARGADPRLGVFALQASIAVRDRQGRYSEAWDRLTLMPDVRTEQFLRQGGRLDADLLDSYAALLRARGDWEKAEALYKMACGRGSDPQAWLGLVMLYLERRDEDPAHADDWYLKARDWFGLLREHLKERLEHGAWQQEPRDRNVHWRRAKDLLSLGPLLVEMKHYEEARAYLAEAIKISTDLGLDGEPVAVGHAYLGLARAGTADFESAMVSLAEALKYDPDNIDYKQRLADLQQQMQLYDRAERNYREVLEVAPCNVDALIGLGEVLTSLGTAQAAESEGRNEAADPDLFKEAWDQLGMALRLAQETACKGVQFRTGSRTLNSRERAALHYGRGYASVKLHQATMQGRLLPRPRPPLTAARRAFTRAVRCDPNHNQAARALRQLKTDKASTASRYGGMILAIICLLILVVVQAAFYLKGFPHFPETLQSNPTIYATLTFGLLAFLMAAISLPELLKLKVGGVQLEKSRTEQIDPLANLSIARDQSFTTRFTRRLGTVRPISPDTSKPQSSSQVKAGVVELKKTQEEQAKPGGDAERAPTEFGGPAGS
jgi:tetratricopeptide (TPR) repeat protein